MVRLTGTTTQSSISGAQIAEMNRDRWSCNSISVEPARQGEVRRARDYYRLNGGSGPHWDIPNNDIKSVTHAILERVFFTKADGGFVPAPKPWTHEAYSNFGPIDSKRLAVEHVQAATNSFRTKMLRLIKRDGKVSTLTEDEFLNRYVGAKRRVYQSAIRSLSEKPLNKRDCRVKTFTKDEYRKPGGAPRAIQPRSPRFNVMLGRYIKHVEHKLFECIDEVFDSTGDHRTVAKGMNLDERGATIQKMWDGFNDPVAVELDASRFDQHINTALLDIEFSMYLAATTPNEDLPSLAQLLSHQKVNEGRYYGSDGKIKYKVQGNRMSGDMNTSLGNVIIMCCLMYSYLDSKTLRHRVKLLNDGDDCVVIMERRALRTFRNGLEDWFLRMGITMKIEGVSSVLEEINFCQTRPVRVGDSYRMVPRPQKRLYSDLVTTKPVCYKKVYNKWIGAVSGCGLAAASDIPIFRDYYKWLSATSTPWIPEEGDYYHKYRDTQLRNMESRKRPISWATRVSFFHAFDIPPKDQMQIEAYFRSLEPLRWSRPTRELGTLRLHPVMWLVPPEQKEPLHE